MSITRVKKIKDILQDVINGCTAANAREEMMVFYIKYFVNPSNTNLKGIRGSETVTITGLENAIYNIVSKNLTIDTSVAITDITMVHNGEIVKVNKESYCYSLSAFMKSLL